MRSAAPPKKKKIHLHTYPAGQKTGGLAQSPHPVHRLDVPRFDPPSRQARCVALSQAGGGRAGSVRRGAFLWRYTESVLPHPPTESICGDTGRSGGVLWRCSHTQSRTQSNTQFDVRLAQSNGGACFGPSLSQIARSPPSRTPKTATPRPYRDTLSQHFVPDLGDLSNTPSLAAGGEQGGIYGAFDPWILGSR